MTRARDLSEIVTSTGLVIDTDTLYVDSVNNRVGIGTSSPNTKLVLSANNGGGAENNTLRFEDTDTGTGTNQVTGKIVFYSSDTTNTGVHSFISGETENTNAAGALVFATGIAGSASEAMRIDNSGNVIIANPTKGLNDTDEGILFSGALPGLSYFTRDGDLAGSFSRLNSYGDVIRIVANGNAAGRIGSGGAGALSFYNADGSSERMRIDSSGNVTIKAPTASGGGVLNLENTTTAVNGTDWGLINFVSNDSSTNASGTRASIAGTSTSFNGDGNLTFSTAPANGSNTERMRIDSSGNLLVGKTSLYSTDQGIHLDPDGTVYGTRPNNASGVFNRKTSDGNIVIFEKDGTTVGSIGSNSSSLFIVDDDTGLFFNRASNNILPYRNDSGNEGVSDDAIDLGRGTGRFKDLYLSGSVKVPAASKGIEYSATSFITPENNTSGAEISTAGTLTVKTGSTPSLAMTVDGSGNLLVGKLTSSYTTDGFEALAAGAIQVSDTSTNPVGVNRNGTDGSLINFFKSGATVGIIGAANGNLYLGQGDTTIMFSASSDAVLPKGTDGADRDGFINLGQDINRFKDLYLSGSINQEFDAPRVLGPTVEFSGGLADIADTASRTLTLNGLNNFAGAILEVWVNYRATGGATAASARKVVQFFEQNNSAGDIVEMEFSGRSIVTGDIVVTDATDGVTITITNTDWFGSSLTGTAGNYYLKILGCATANSTISKT